MKVTRLPPGAGLADPPLALALVRAIGAPHFAAELMDAVTPTLPVSHCTVFGLRADGRMEPVSSASARGEAATIAAVEYLRLGFDRQDSNTLWLHKRKPGKATQCWIGHQFAHQVQDAAYRRVCYEEPGIRERLSLLTVFPGGYRVSVSLYRNHAYADFSPQDMAWLGRQAPLMAAAVMRHVQLGAPAPAGDAAQTERDLLAALPARERELIAHVLAGLTTREAAQAMGIAHTTALTYRYRAFHHLGLRNQRELLGLLRKASVAAAA